MQTLAFSCWLSYFILSISAVDAPGPHERPPVFITADGCNGDGNTCCQAHFKGFMDFQKNRQVMCAADFIFRGIGRNGADVISREERFAKVRRDDDPILEAVGGQRDFFSAAPDASQELRDGLLSIAPRLEICKVLCGDTRPRRPPVSPPAVRPPPDPAAIIPIEDPPIINITQRDRYTRDCIEGTEYLPPADGRAQHMRRQVKVSIQLWFLCHPGQKAEVTYETFYGGKPFVVEQVQMIRTGCQCTGDSLIRVERTPHGIKAQQSDCVTVNLAQADASMVLYVEAWGLDAEFSQLSITSSSASQSHSRSAADIHYPGRTIIEHDYSLLRR